MFIYTLAFRTLNYLTELEISIFKLFNRFSCLITTVVTQSWFGVFYNQVCTIQSTCSKMPVIHICITKNISETSSWSTIVHHLLMKTPTALLFTVCLCHCSFHCYVSDLFLYLRPARKVSEFPIDFQGVRVLDPGILPIATDNFI